MDMEKIARQFSDVSIIAVTNICIYVTITYTISQYVLILTAL